MSANEYKIQSDHGTYVVEVWRDGKLGFLYAPVRPHQRVMLSGVPDYRIQARNVTHLHAKVLRIIKSRGRYFKKEAARRKRIDDFVTAQQAATA